MADKWSYAYADDWIAVYKNGDLHWEGHSVDWSRVFEWLGFDEPEFIGEFDWSQSGYAPKKEADLYVALAEEKDRQDRIDELENELRRLKGISV